MRDRKNEGGEAGMSYSLGRNSVVATAFAMAVSMATMALPVFAQDITDEHLAAARSAINASQSTAQLDNILPEMGERTKQQLIANRPDAADQINTIVDEVTITLAPRRGDLETEIARSYARIFTVEELKQMTEFYSSETGQKLLRETPLVARTIQESARVWGQGIQRDLQQEVGKRIEEAGLQ